MQLRRLSTRCVDIRRSLVLLVVAMAEWLSLRWMVDGLELPLPRGYRVILEAPLVLIRLKLLVCFMSDLQESDERAERRVILAAVAIHKKASPQSGETTPLRILPDSVRLRSRQLSNGMLPGASGRRRSSSLLGVGRRSFPAAPARVCKNPLRAAPTQQRRLTWLYKAWRQGKHAHTQFMLEV